MFIRCALLTIAGMICSSAQPAPMFNESDRVAIEKMYDRYVQAFIKRDYATLRECVHVPFLVWTGGELQTLGSVDAVIENYRKQLVALEARNYDRAEILSTRITALTAESALVNKSIRRFKKDGSVLEEIAAMYPVCKAAGNWKLCGLVRQDPRQFGKIY